MKTPEKQLKISGEMKTPKETVTKNPKVREITKYN